MRNFHRLHIPHHRKFRHRSNKHANDRQQLNYNGRIRSFSVNHSIICRRYRWLSPLQRYWWGELRVIQLISSEMTKVSERMEIAMCDAGMLFSIPSMKPSRFSICSYITNHKFVDFCFRHANFQLINNWKLWMIEEKLGK